MASHQDFKGEEFRWSKFHDNLKESKLQGDGLLHLKRFCNSIDTTLASTIVCNTGIGEYASLYSITSTKSKLVSPLAHADYNLCNPAYFHLSRILRDHLLKRNVVSSISAPKSYNTLTRYKIDDDGFNILQKLVFTGRSQLGGEERNMYEFINTLTIIHAEYLVNLYHRAKTMEQEIILQQDKNGHHNRLVKKFIDLISCIPHFQVHLTSVIKSTHKFFRTLPRYIL